MICVCICIYMIDWVTLLYSRNWPNIVNQLCFIKKKKKKEAQTVGTLSFQIMELEGRVERK